MIGNSGVGCGEAKSVSERVESRIRGWKTILTEDLLSNSVNGWRSGWVESLI